MGGVLTSPRGIMMDTYSWNLGLNMNNVAEAYALLKGIQITTGLHIKKLTVIGDSKLIISYLVQNNNPKNYLLKRIIERIRNTIKVMNIYFYHTRHVNNGKADDQENKAIDKGNGNLEINGRSTFLVPP
jgi:ribonuclease HI